MKIFEMSSTTLILIAVMVALGFFAVAYVDGFNIGEAKSPVGECASFAKNNTAKICHEFL